MKLVAVAAAVLALALLFIWSCSSSSPTLDVEFLASDLHFNVGGHHLVVPAIALRGPDRTFDLSGRKPEKSRKETLKSEATEPGHPMKTDKLDLVIRQYGFTGESLTGDKICASLLRRWTKSLCLGERRGLLMRLPEKFDLLDRTKLDILKTHWTVGKERQYDQVKNMAMQPGITELGCDKDSRFCTALVEVLPGLVAVWTTWADPNTGEMPEDIGPKQGAAIVQFVRRGISPVEDPTLADAD